VNELDERCKILFNRAKVPERRGPLSVHCSTPALLWLATLAGKTSRREWNIISEAYDI